MTLLALLLAAFSTGHEAHAAVIFESLGAAANQGDFVVSPGKTEITVTPGQLSGFEIDLANRLGHDATFTLSVEDIKGSDDPAQPVILLGDDRGPNSLRDFLSPASTSLRIPAGMRARVPVTIAVPADATPGGLYGSVTVGVTTVAASAAAGGVSGVSPVETRVAVLCFVRVAGDTVESGRLEQFSLGGGHMFLMSEPGNLDFNLLFRNDGTVNLDPSGTISIHGWTASSTASIAVDPWFALPGSLRLRQVTWQTPFLFGRYVAVARVSRGYGTAVDVQTVVFWVLPWKILVGAFILVVIVIVGIVKLVTGMRSAGAVKK